ncbi:GDSL-type esterase/lipase family protein [Olivibacter sp. XZL3]|uniref:GDSL-type esterase/lipase family protein n=1 Tax=Olivibacter sp. XZL3 TaxID=1735116 RepID=UPI001066AF4E|nr:GDSL-type esterase/lipase family protein [Olivibacter sp. XZL3]
MNYILLLYLLSISAGAIETVNKPKTSKASTASTPDLLLRRIPTQRYNESFDFINPSKDTIGNVHGLSAFYQKLIELKAGKRQRVSIVQIGDSHIQPDLISREVRLGLQDFFGDAGRGLVFPYQVARTNGPLDISSSTSTPWAHSRISQQRSRVASGVSGFGLSKVNGQGKIKLSLKPDISAKQQSFDVIKLFVGPGAWSVSAIGNDLKTYRINQSSIQNFETKEILLNDFATGFNITPLAATPLFFGASLEKHNSPGVLFHTIGVNGARYEQYNRQPQFWQQLPALQADLYILSMGTNEAFYNGMTEEIYINQVAETVAKIQTIDASASILITTTAESFKNGRRNPMIERLNLALKFYCNKMGIPIWDLFDITGGSGSSAAWLKNNLLQADKVHYQQRAYSMQGALLYDALAKGYNTYLANNTLSLALETKTAGK